MSTFNEAMMRRVSMNAWCMCLTQSLGQDRCKQFGGQYNTISSPKKRLVLAGTQTFMVQIFPGKKKEKTPGLSRNGPLGWGRGFAILEIFSSLHGIQSDSFNGLCFKLVQGITLLFVAVVVSLFVCFSFCLNQNDLSSSGFFRGLWKFRVDT